MSDVSIRPATAADQNVIKQMVRDENLDRSSLHWSHFLIAQDAGAIIGIGQIRPYPKCRELGSLVVKKEYRGQHIGEKIIAALLAQESGDVYLECLRHNETYYNRAGFYRIPWYQAPMPLKLKSFVGGTLIRLFGYHVIAMKRDRPI
ncbi:MAG: GNAT family N-acetyltransferase [Anaerolineae bacterium]